MSRKLSLVIESGEKTCASAPGRFCQYLGVKAFGTKHVCLLFRDDFGNEAELAEDVPGGWLQRHIKCLDAEVKS